MYPGALQRLHSTYEDDDGEVKKKKKKKKDERWLTPLFRLSLLARLADDDRRHRFRWHSCHFETKTTLFVSFKECSSLREGKAVGDISTDRSWVGSVLGFCFLEDCFRPWSTERRNWDGLCHCY